MSTIHTAKIIEEMLRNKGKYKDDPAAVAIYTYIHANTNTPLFAVFWRHRDNDMASSPYVADFSLLMRDGELTCAGEEWLQKRERGIE